MVTVGPTLLAWYLIPHKSPTQSTKRENFDDRDHWDLDYSRVPPTGQYHLACGRHSSQHVSPASYLSPLHVRPATLHVYGLAYPAMVTPLCPFLPGLITDLWFVYITVVATSIVDLPICQVIVSSRI